MKDGLNYALFGTVVAVAAGLFGAYGIPDFSQTETSSFAAAQMLGHVTYTVTDADGNIKAYRQLDNIIVNQGEDCAATLLFTNVTGGAQASTNIIPDTGTGNQNTCWTTTGAYVHIAIGNGSKSGTLVAAGTDTALQQEHNMTLTGLERITDSRPVFTSAAGATAAKVVLSKDFTLDIAGGANPGVSSPMIVNESGLFNSTTVTEATTGVSPPLSSGGVGMFARQTFADVTISDGESLTVEWTINIGGTAGFTGPEEN